MTASTAAWTASSRPYSLTDTAQRGGQRAQGTLARLQSGAGRLIQAQERYRLGIAYREALAKMGGVFDLIEDRDCHRASGHVGGSVGRDEQLVTAEHEAGGFAPCERLRRRHGDQFTLSTPCRKRSSLSWFSGVAIRAWAPGNRCRSSTSRW